MNFVTVLIAAFGSLSFSTVSLLGLRMCRASDTHLKQTG